MDIVGLPGLPDWTFAKISHILSDLSNWQEVQTGQSE